MTPKASFSTCEYLCSERSIYTLPVPIDFVLASEASLLLGQSYSRLMKWQFLWMGHRLIEHPQLWLFHTHNPGLDFIWSTLSPISLNTLSLRMQIGLPQSIIALTDTPLFSQSTSNVWASTVQPIRIVCMGDLGEGPLMGCPPPCRCFPARANLSGSGVGTHKTSNLVQADHAFMLAFRGDGMLPIASSVAFALASSRL